MRFLIKLIAGLALVAAPCLASVSVTAQPAGSISPADIVANASSSNAITGWCIYVDSVLVFRQRSGRTVEVHNFSSDQYAQDAFWGPSVITLPDARKATKPVKS